MSAIDDIIAGIGAIIEQANETTGTVAAALQQAEEGIGQAEALGASGTVQGLGQVKDELEALAGQIAAFSSAADDVQTTAMAVAEGN